MLPCRRLAIGLTILLSVALTAGNAAADKCTALKLKAMGKKEAGLLACQGKVAAKGDPSVEPACDAKVKTKFAAAFAKAGTCVGVQFNCANIADDCSAKVRAGLPDAGPSKCEAARLKVAGKKAAAKLGCYAKAALEGAAVDTTCLMKAQTKFSAAFNKTTGCSGDEASVESLVDTECVAQQVVVDGGGNLTDLCPQVCGNGSVEVGEQCDAGSPCGVGVTCSADCTCPCDFLDPAACLYPFPNDYFTVADATTDTGKRVHFATAAMPQNSSNVSIDPTPYNLNDGFSPGASILTKVPNVDLVKTGASPITDIARSLDANAPVVLVNATTLAHQLMFVELDANASTDANRTLIIHPSINLTENTRYIVALRNMQDSSGNVLTPNPDFQAYRDNTPLADPVKEVRRAHMEDIFTTLADAGVPRGNLYLAWDFTVASRRNLTERMLFVRDDGFSRLGANAPSFTVTNVLEHPCTAGNPTFGACATDADCTGGGTGSCNTSSNGIDGDILRRMVGTYNVERYVDSTTAPAKFILDSNGLPTHQSTPQPASFICNIPRSALASDNSPAVAARGSLYGHGLLGSNTEVSAGNVEDMANGHNFVFCATKWIGMSNEDLINAIGILGNLSGFPTLADRLQQGMLDQLYLARLMIHPNGFVSDPAFQDSVGGALIDTSNVFYDGNSQGGIFGGTVMAIAQDITRGVLGVPGMNYSLLLTRSTDFSSYAAILYPAYPNELTRPLLLALIQMLWDRADPSGYAHHITSDPLPDTPVHKVLMQEAFGDHQVANVACEIEARTLGVFVHQPALAAGRSYEVTPFYGITPIPSYPFDGSALVMWDSGAAQPPTTNTPPLPGRCSNDATRECSTNSQCVSPGVCNNVPDGFDPHGDPRKDPNAQLQKSEFLKANGAVVDVCSGAPCTTVH